jgi:hypothetical protein
MLDLSKINGLKEIGSKYTGQCPACAEKGKDTKGNHLFIDKKTGKFGCVVNPGKVGNKHRKRINELIGGVNGTQPAQRKITVHPFVYPADPEVIAEGVLGRLGRLFEIYADMGSEENDERIIAEKEYFQAVPSVPNLELSVLFGEQEDLEISRLIQLIEDSEAYHESAAPRDLVDRN